MGAAYQRVARRMSGIRSVRRGARYWWLLLGGALCVSCTAVADGVIARSGLLSVVASGPRDARVLRLDAAPGVRINARLLPRLEFGDGTSVSFNTSSVTADSSYFIASPTATLGSSVARHGTLLVSVCPASARVCLQEKLEVDLR